MNSIRIAAAFIGLVAVGNELAFASTESLASCKMNGEKVSLVSQEEGQIILDFGSPGGNLVTMSHVVKVNYFEYPDYQSYYEIELSNGRTLEIVRYLDRNEYGIWDRWVAGGVCDQGTVEFNTEALSRLVNESKQLELKKYAFATCKNSEGRNGEVGLTTITVRQGLTLGTAVFEGSISDEARMSFVATSFQDFLNPNGLSEVFFQGEGSINFAAAGPKSVEQQSFLVRQNKIELNEPRYFEKDFENCVLNNVWFAKNLIIEKN